MGKGKIVKDYVVYETTDYDIFKKLEGNREVAAVSAIVSSIKSIGFIDNPILVNEKMEVVDGQNRLDACIELDIPVLYHIVEGIGIDEAIAMNIGRKNWKPIDYLYSYANRGYEPYIKLRECYEMSHLDLAILTNISQKRASVNGFRGGDGFKKGLYEMSDDEYKRLKNTLPWLLENKEYFDKINASERMIYTCFAFCYNIKETNISRLQTIIKKNYCNFEPFSDVERFLKQISDFYNKSLKAGQIRFDHYVS